MPQAPSATTGIQNPPELIEPVKSPEIEELGQAETELDKMLEKKTHLPSHGVSILGALTGQPQAEWDETILEDHW